MSSVRFYKENRGILFLSFKMEAFSLYKRHPIKDCNKVIVRSSRRLNGEQEIALIILRYVILNIYS